MLLSSCSADTANFWNDYIEGVGKEFNRTNEKNSDQKLKTY